MAILGAALVWVTLTVLASGGVLGIDEVRLLILDPVGATAGTPGATESVVWTTQWWEGTPVHVDDRRLPAGQHPDTRHGASALLGRRAVGSGRGRGRRRRGLGHRLDSSDRRARRLVHRWGFLHTRGAAPDRLERGVDAPADHEDVDGIVRDLDQPGSGGGSGGVRPAAESLMQGSSFSTAAAIAFSGSISGTRRQETACGIGRDPNNLSIRRVPAARRRGRIVEKPAPRWGLVSHAEGSGRANQDVRTVRRHETGTAVGFPRRRRAVRGLC